MHPTGLAENQRGVTASLPPASRPSHALPPDRDGRWGRPSRGGCGRLHPGGFPENPRGVTTTAPTRRPSHAFPPDRDGRWGQPRRGDAAGYTQADHAVLLESTGAAVKRLVSPLASHIADEAGRMGAAGDVVLAGGGSPIAGMVGALEGALGANIMAVDDPIMSNAAGFEAKAVALPPS